ncbi:MAG: tRNA (adenosine(37)-N6)-dimethylallyltransferase MiaA [Parachlamydiaceae bacterium]|nr:tRNA (adenosine(37)-N6)-dimethylallyltransferase MiaA [Parachlamydiaceae bacterium]
MSGGVVFETEEVKRIIQKFALEAKQQIPINFQRKKKRVIVIAGPTCCGKTAMAIELAAAMDGEVISADSMQVYRGMDIGTAKVTTEERLIVPHHLIDIRDIHESYNVVDFYYEARQQCQQIIDRGHVPIVAGGSGFYLHALIYGPPSGPPSLPELRKTLEIEMDQLGSEALYLRLLELDPQYAKSITKNDKQKIVRALEIITLTHKKVSKLPWKGRRKPQNFDFQCWFLHRPKDVLYQRINERCDRMLKDGFLEEVKKLDQMGLRDNHSASQAIGYRQALDFLSTDQSEAEYLKFVSQFKQATRNYAKRQFTWFQKRREDFRWVDVDMHDHEVVFEMIRNEYERL